ncbi:MAG: DUF3034 family protein [Xanthomonadales bacterium]|nr:DUF3034 family protein [Xanthomonadales bacterium]
MNRWVPVVILCALAPVVAAAQGGLLATSAASSIEGGAGGGLSPWAVLTGYATRDELGGSAFATHLDTGDYSLTTAGAAVNFRNRVELSAARQSLDVSVLGAAVDELEQTVVSAKLKLTGDLVYGPWPQTTLGIQYKDHGQADIVTALGAAEASGTDIYLSSTRLILDGLFGRSTLISGTVRATAANQAGLLGFGNAAGDSRELVFEAALGVFLTREWLLAGEYREKPDQLSFAGEDHWRDVFLAWFPNKTWSAVAAWVDLGDIAGRPDQEAWYLSVQVSF